MSNDTPRIVPISEAINTDPDVAETMRQLEAGEISVCSPFPGMDKPWTQDEKDRLDRALAEIFDWDIKSSPEEDPSYTD